MILRATLEHAYWVNARLDYHLKRVEFAATPEDRELAELSLEAARYNLYRKDHAMALDALDDEIAAEEAAAAREAELPEVF